MYHCIPQIHRFYTWAKFLLFYYNLIFIAKSEILPTDFSDSVSCLSEKFSIYIMAPRLPLYQTSINDNSKTDRELTII